MAPTIGKVFEINRVCFIKKKFGQKSLRGFERSVSEQNFVVDEFSNE